MINFDIKYSNNLVSGLNFQITSVIDNVPNLNQSLVISEDLFALIENDFSSVFHESSDKYKYYHWSQNFHDQSDIGKIIRNLNNTKNIVMNNNIQSLNYFWLENDDILFLERNHNEFIFFIEQVIKFYMKIN